MEVYHFANIQIFYLYNRDGSSTVSCPYSTADNQKTVKEQKMAVVKELFKAYYNGELPLEGGYIFSSFFDTNSTYSKPTLHLPS